MISVTLLEEGVFKLKPSVVFIMIVILATSGCVFTSPALVGTSKIQFDTILIRDPNYPQIHSFIII